MPDSTPSNEHAPETRCAGRGEHHALGRVDAALRKTLNRILLYRFSSETWRNRLVTSAAISIPIGIVLTIFPLLGEGPGVLRSITLASTLQTFAMLIVFFFVLLSIAQLLHVWLFTESSDFAKPPKRIQQFKPSIRTWQGRIGNTACIVTGIGIGRTIALVKHGGLALPSLSTLAIETFTLALSAICIFFVLSVTRLFQILLTMNSSTKNPLICDHCKYDLRGIPGNSPCPECGTPRDEPKPAS